MEKATLEGTPKAARSATPVYACCIEASRRARRDIDRDVIRGRRLEFDRKFLPDALSKVDELAFLEPAEKRFLSQVQGRTYANMFGLVERFICAKMLEVSRDHVFRRCRACSGSRKSRPRCPVPRPSTHATM